MYAVYNGNGEMLGLFKAGSRIEAYHKAELFFRGQIAKVKEA